MKTRTCNIHTFARKFQDEYNFCYDCGDFISSDREAAAFMFAMESMGLLD